MNGETIRKLRKAVSLTQESLAKKLGVSKQTICNWENGRVKPSVEILQRLADVMGVSCDTLLDRGDVMLDVSDLSEVEISAVKGVIDAFKAKR